MMSYLTRPRDVIPEPRPMAQGGRIGFYKGESVVKSHGQQIKELTEAGESSVSIAKKLKLRQQTVNSAMRHLMENGMHDIDGVRHSAKIAWRALAHLQKEIEEDTVRDEQWNIDQYNRNRLPHDQIISGTE